MGDTLECQSEIGIVVGLVDAAIGAINALKCHDTSPPEVQEAIKDLIAALRRELPAINDTYLMAEQWTRHEDFVRRKALRDRERELHNMRRRTPPEEAELARVKGELLALPNWKYSPEDEEHLKIIRTSAKCLREMGGAL